MGATSYSEAVGIYLGVAISRFADRNKQSLSNLGFRARQERGLPLVDLRARRVSGTFSHRQAIPMVWDFGEGKPVQRFRSEAYARCSSTGIEPAIRLRLFEHCAMERHQDVSQHSDAATQDKSYR